MSLTRREDVCNGEVVITGTEVRVAHIIEDLAKGAPLNDLCIYYNISHAAITAALRSIVAWIHNNLDLPKEECSTEVKISVDHVIRIDSESCGKECAYLSDQGYQWYCDLFEAKLNSNAKTCLRCAECLDASIKQKAH